MRSSLAPLNALATSAADAGALRDASAARTAWACSGSVLGQANFAALAALAPFAGRPPVRLGDGGVEIVVDLPQDRHQPLPVDPPLLVRQPLVAAAAEFFEDVVHVRDRQPRMRRLLPLAMRRGVVRAQPGSREKGIAGSRSFSSLRSDRKKISPSATVFAASSNRFPCGFAESNLMNQVASRSP
jgi:hypothetical protein